jgi:hypothetical protein
LITASSGAAAGEIRSGTYSGHCETASSGCGICRATVVPVSGVRSKPDLIGANIDGNSYGVSNRVGLNCGKAAFNSNPMIMCQQQSMLAWLATVPECQLR